MRGAESGCVCLPESEMSAGELADKVKSEWALEKQRKSEEGGSEYLPSAGTRAEWTNFENMLSCTSHQR